jgi:hypothetical protein
LFVIAYIFRKHIFTSFCAAAWTFSLNFKHIDTNQKFFPLYIVMVFAAVWLAYNYQYTTHLSKHKSNYILLLVGILLAGSYYPLKRLSANYRTEIFFNLVYAAVVFCILIALSYKMYLRKIPYLKAPLIAICWTMVCKVIPELIFSEHTHILVIIEVFLITLCICILFDLKHKNYDTGKIKTLATLLGNHYTIAVCMLILSGAGYISIMLCQTNLMLLFYACGIAAIISFNQFKNTYLFQFIYEGILMLHGVLILI